MAKQLPKLILASRSPRRRELLAAAGIRSRSCRPPRRPSAAFAAARRPRKLVARLAYQKAADVARRIGRGLVLGCDTVAECGGQILGKPADQEHARAMLKTLSGREHRVSAGCACGRSRRRAGGSRGHDHAADGRTHAPATRQYLAGGQWEGKAGAFGYQDGLDWVHVVEGSESNVVGLPMELLAEMIAKLNVPSPFGRGLG